MTIRKRLAIVAAACTLLGAAACDDEQAPPFEVEGSGEIAGQLFFDADNNGLYTPFGGDTLLKDVEVKLLVRNDTTTLASTRTTSDGRFAFTGVAPGTHQLVVATQASTAALKFCTLPAPTSVYRAEQTFLRVPAKLGCVVRIAEAKNVTAGQTTTVAGIVTTNQGTYRSDNVYIEDPTGGIQIFGVPGSLALQIGDSIEVTGTIAAFRDELQVVSPIIAPNITEVDPLEPTVRTAAQITAAAANGVGPKSPDVGRLLTVRTVTNVGAFTSGNAPLTDPTGAIQLRLDGNASTAIPAATFQAGTCYDITGILGYSFGILQLKPRTLADIEVVACPA